MGVTDKLAGFVARTRFEDIPVDVVQLTKRIILDTIGNAVAGASTSGSRRAVESVGQWGGPAHSSIIAAGAKTSPMFATFANVTLACALEADETVANIGHIGHCALMPALALGEAEQMSGRELLTAVALAYEFGGRVGGAGRSVVRDREGKLNFGATGVGSNWVIFPAAASAARALGLDSVMTASVFGMAGLAASIPTGRRWNRPRWNNMKYNAYGFMAQNAVQSALLARNGFTGDPDIFDGDAREVKAPWWSMAGFPAHDADKAVAGLGETWVMRETAFKPYPSCRFTHGILDGFRKIIAENALAPHEIEAIDTFTGRTLFVFKMQHPDVACEEDASFSTPHVLAMAALGVPIGPQWVAPRYWNDPAVAALKAKVTCHVSEEANALVVEQLLANRFEKFPYRVVVRARGRTFEASGDYAWGDSFVPETAFGDTDIIAKFERFTEGGLPAPQARRCIDLVMNLERAARLEDLCAAFS